MCFGLQVADKAANGRLGGFAAQPILVPLEPHQRLRHVVAIRDEGC